jgi:hypothetical protein
MSARGKNPFKAALIAIVTVGFLLMAIGGGYLVYSVSSSRDLNEHRYLIPEGFTGLIQVEFGISSASPLPRSGKTFLYRVPESGVLQTSTESAKVKPGPAEFYYADERGQRRQIGLFEEFIHGLGTGTDPDASGKDRTVVRYFVGTAEQFADYQTHRQGEGT